MSKTNFIPVNVILMQSIYKVDMQNTCVNRISSKKDNEFEFYLDISRY